MSRKMTKREEMMAERIAFLEGLLEKRDAMVLDLNDKRMKMETDRNHYRGWVAMTFEAFSKCRSTPYYFDIPAWLTSMYELRGAGMP
jgi:hypothetical protein